MVGTASVAEPQGVSVYNFTVADDHTYFVEGASNNDTTGTAAATPLDAVWVHNSCNLASNETYWVIGKDGRPEYVGVTNNFARRSAEHLRNGLLIQRIDGLTQLSRFDARTAEQAVIEKYGLRADGGILRNLINSISRRSPKYGLAIQRGKQLLASAGL